MVDEKSHVLIVDDDDMLCKALATRLSWAGYSVDSVPNGRRAIDQCSHHTPQVMILDVSLPDIDGYQVCRTVRSKLLNDYTAIIFLTGASQDELGDIDRFLDRVGGQFFLRKPYDTQNLIGLLDSITGTKRLASNDWLSAWSLN